MHLIFIIMSFHAKRVFFKNEHLLLLNTPEIQNKLLTILWSEVRALHLLSHLSHTPKT
jgi:hypothetical protein